MPGVPYRPYKNDKKISQWQLCDDLTYLSNSYTDTWLATATHIHYDDNTSYQTNYRVNIDTVLKSAYTLSQSYISDCVTDKVNAAKQEIKDEIEKEWQIDVIQTIVKDEVKEQIAPFEDKITYSYNAITTLSEPENLKSNPIYKTISEHFVEKQEIVIQDLDS